MNVAALANPSSPAAQQEIADLTAQRRAPSAHAKPFNAASLRSADPAEQRAAVAAQFEAILARQLLSKTMTSMLGSETSGPAANVYGDMLTDTLANQLTAGPGLGLGRLLQQQLTPKGELSPTTKRPAA
jgi:Rod binding domain-containing protein